MPRGTCQVCGCTDERACQGGCGWVDEDHTHCSQCVGWGLLRERPTFAPNPFRGVFPHDLVPLCDLEPFMADGPMGKPRKAGHRIDLRRLDEETLARIAFIAAPENDGTVEEFVAKAAAGQAVMLVPAATFLAVIAAFSFERAVELIPAAAREVEAAEKNIFGGLAHG